MFKLFMRLQKSWLRQIFCEHDFKVIVIPIEYEQKKSDKMKQVIKSDMFKKCNKCSKIVSIYSRG